MCSLCWLGATERQRRDAIFGEGSDDCADVKAGADAVRAASEIRALEALLSLPAVDPPEPEHLGEAA